MAAELFVADVEAWQVQLFDMVEEGRLVVQKRWICGAPDVIELTDATHRRVVEHIPGVGELHRAEFDDPRVRTFALTDRVRVARSRR